MTPLRPGLEAAPRFWTLIIQLGHQVDGHDAPQRRLVLGGGEDLTGGSGGAAPG
jgi:hypothetical protein